MSPTSLIPVVLTLVVAGDGPEASTVRLDYPGRTLEEIVAGLNADGPNRVDLAPDPAGSIGQAPRREMLVGPPRLYHLVHPGRPTFWEAIDVICAATGRTPLISRDRVTLHPLLNPGRPATPARSVSAGAFRIALTELSYDRAIDFGVTSSPGRPPPPTTDRARFTARLSPTPEPRLRLVAIEDVTLTEATDDLGRSLLIPGLSRQPNDSTPPSGFNTPASITARLVYPTDPPRTIRRLRGTIGLVVTGRAPTEAETRVDLPFDFVDVPVP